MIFEVGRGVRIPSGSAHALHPPMSKSRADVLLIFQCPGKCLTLYEWTYLCLMIPLLFAQLCITEFYLGKDQSQIRIKSEVGTVKHVEALQFFFLLAQISSIVCLNVKNMAFTPTVCVCVCVGGVGGGGGGGG